MLSPLIRRTRKNDDPHSKQRGVTILLVAVSMVAIIGMAALSIDVGTLYQAKAEAQRSADAAALAAARVISISGITGDPNNTAGGWQNTCGTTGNTSNPLTGSGVASGSVISSSTSIVSLPIYDGTTLTPGLQPPVNIVGFLQVFINSVDGAGNINVTVLNVAGCGNGVTAGTASLTGTSPVPVRLITPP